MTKTKDIIERIREEFAKRKSRVTVNVPDGVPMGLYRKRLYSAAKRRGRSWRFALDVFLRKIHVIK